MPSPRQNFFLRSCSSFFLRLTPPINVMGSEAPPLYMRASALIASSLVVRVSFVDQGLPSLVPFEPPLGIWQLTILACVPLREHLTSGVRPERTHATRKRRVSTHKPESKQRTNGTQNAKAPQRKLSSPKQLTSCTKRHHLYCPVMYGKRRTSACVGLSIMLAEVKAFRTRVTKWRRTRMHQWSEGNTL